MAVVHDCLRDSMKLYRDLVALQARYGSDPDVEDALRCLGALIKDLRNRVTVLERRRSVCQAQSLSG